MDFLKKHYEKILLGVVLLGLAVASGFLPWMIASERASLKAKSQEIIDRRIEPLPPLNLSNVTHLIQRAGTPLSLVFSCPNKLFNPVPWQKRADGMLVKISCDYKTGADLVVVTNITPLYTIFTLDSVTPAAADTPAHYLIGVVREAAVKPAQRGKRQYLSMLNNKNDTFTVGEVKGPSGAPELVIELNDTGERAVLNKDKPFKREDGYMADLQYEPEKRFWVSRRVGDKLKFGGEEYNIVAINRNEVVLSNKLNNKKTPRPFNPGP